MSESSGERERSDERAATISVREELLVEAERVAHMGSWIWNLETNQVHWSDELFRILGYDPAKDEASTDAFFRAVHPEDVDRVRAASARGVQTHVAEQVDYRVLRADGTVRHVTMTGALIFDAGGTLRRVVGTVLDVTEQRLLEEQLMRAQKLEAVGRLAGGVAHDLNNHLMVIQGNLEVLRLPPSPELDALRGAIVSASEMTSRLLAFGRSSPLKRRPTDANQLVAQTFVLMKRIVPEDIALVSDLEPGLPLVDIDEAMIGQCLVNLVLNARDAVRSGGRIEVTTRIAPDARDAVEIAVADDGEGMDETVRSRLFEPFFTTKPQGKGTGLGLAMVQGAVAQHGGTVDVASQPGRGSRFAIRLPVSRMAPAETVRADDPARPCAVSTILVVEDQAAVADVLRALLEADGHRVLVARQPALAIELARSFEGEIDLIISDVVLPEMRGPAVVQEILRTTRHRPRVVFMSGYARDEVESDVEVRLKKPFKRAELRQAIADALRVR